MFQDLRDLRGFYALFAVSATPAFRHNSILMEEDSTPTESRTNTAGVCIDSSTGQWSYCQVDALDTLADSVMTRRTSDVVSRLPYRALWHAQRR